MSAGLDPFDRQLAGALRPEPAPIELRRSLLHTTRNVRARRWRKFVGIAASVFIVLGALWLGVGRRPQGERWTEAALKNYVDVKRLDFVRPPESGECSEVCRRWSAEAVGFSADLPRSLAGQPIRGGRACRLAGQRTACFLLRDGRAVYVFERKIQGVDSAEPIVSVAAGLQARSWNEGDQGYILVEPPDR